MKYKLGDVLCIKDKTSALWNGGGPILVSEKCNTAGQWIDDTSVSFNYIKEYPFYAKYLDYFKKPETKFQAMDKVISVKNTSMAAEGWIGYISKTECDGGYDYCASKDGRRGPHEIAFYEDELEMLSAVPRSSSPIEVEQSKGNSLSALDKQVSGSHYKDFKIQPAEYCHANNIPFLEGNVIKYTSRHRAKNGKKDLEKAIHCLELLIELEYKE